MSRSPLTDRRVCEELLPAVSRTFALTIRVLPAPLRDAVTTAYLLCRIADTLEDSTEADPEARIGGLEVLGQALAGADRDPRDLYHSLDFAEGLRLREAASIRLLRDRMAVFRAFASLPPAEREAVSHWVQAMCAGMSTFVAREIRRPAVVGMTPDWRAGALPAAASAGASVSNGPAVPFVLDTVEELRAYAWYVAGTVGHLLTDLFSLQLGRSAAPWERMRKLAGPFGLGLQFTNILQDLSEDRKRGWSYVPEELARRYGTSARALDDPAERPAALRVVGELVGESAAYLDRAMEYVLLLPRRAPRIRLFCLWPTFFAVRTLVRLWGEERVLTGGEKIRITRGEVRRVIRTTALSCFSDAGLARLYKSERDRLARRIAHCPI